MQIAEKEIITKIENNLFSLYRFIGSKGKINLFEDKHFNWVNAIPSPWPCFIFDTKVPTKEGEKYFEWLNKKIDSKEAPPFWIRRNTNDNIAEVNERHGFRLVMQWPGMAIEIDKIDITHTPLDDFSIEVVNDINRFKIWLEIAYIELFNSNTFDIDAFIPLLNRPDISFYLGSYKGEEIATSLAFTSQEVVGLYMISTKKEFQGKGIGKAITIKPLIDAKLQGYSYGVLQANEESVGLYRKIGFKEYCKFDIFWKVGKKYI